MSSSSLTTSGFGEERSIGELGFQESVDNKDNKDPAKENNANLRPTWADS